MMNWIIRKHYGNIISLVGGKTPFFWDKFSVLWINKKKNNKFKRLA